VTTLYSMCHMTGMCHRTRVVCRDHTVFYGSYDSIPSVSHDSYICEIAARWQRGGGSVTALESACWTFHVCGLKTARRDGEGGGGNE